MKQYFNAVFIIDKINTILYPYKINSELYLYMICNNYYNFAIITATISEQIEDITKNIELNKQLEYDIQYYDYIYCYGADSVLNYTHREESFIVFNIYKENAIDLCKRYNQDCILYGEVNKIPYLMNKEGENIMDII